MPSDLFRGSNHVVVCATVLRQAQDEGGVRGKILSNPVVSPSNRGVVCSARPSTDAGLRSIAPFALVTVAPKDGPSVASPQCAPFRRLRSGRAFAKAAAMNLFLLALVPA